MRTVRKGPKMRKMRRPLPLVALFTAALSAGCSDSGTPADETRGSAEEARAMREGDGARQLGSATPSSEAAVTPSQRAATPPEDLAPQGRQVYLSSCIACHNADPAKDGALGPAVAGASVVAVIESEEKGVKVYGVKRRHHSRSRTRWGHRQKYTLIRVTKIVEG